MLFVRHSGVNRWPKTVRTDSKSVIDRVYACGGPAARPRLFARTRN